MRGFTFFDMLMLLVVLMIVGIVAIPDALTRLAVREDVRAIRELQRIAVEEAALLAGGRIDRDGDGRPEYGFLTDLARPTPSTGDAPPGVARLGGFFVTVLLPDSTGAPVGIERSDEVDPDLAEIGFLAVAWPAEAGRSGVRVFAVDSGLLVAENINEGGVFSGRAFPIDSLPPIAVSANGGLRPRGSWPTTWVLPVPDTQRARLAMLLTEARLPVPAGWAAPDRN